MSSELLRSGRGAGYLSGMATLSIDCRQLTQAGVGTYLHQLLPRIMEAAAGHHFQLLGDPDVIRAQAWSRPARVTRLSSRIVSVAEQVELPARISRDAGLFWAPQYNAPLLYRGQMVVTIHDVLPATRTQLVWGAHRRAAARLALRQIGRRAAAILCVSAFTADELARVTGRRHPALHVVRSGVASDWFHIPPGPRPHPRPYFLAVGDVKPQKNYPALLRAHASLAAALPHDLVIVGRTEGFVSGDPGAVRLARDAGGRVVFAGRVPHDALRQYYRHAEALVFPSLYEGFGLPPLEAMAAGVPVIASSAAAIPEVCGDAALYCDPHRPADIAAAMRRLAGSSELRAELVEKGRARARRFTWERAAAETWAVMEGVLGNRE